MTARKKGDLIALGLITFVEKEASPIRFNKSIHSVMVFGHADGSLMVLDLFGAQSEPNPERFLTKDTVTSVGLNGPYTAQLLKTSTDSRLKFIYRNCEPNILTINGFSWFSSLRSHTAQVRLDTLDEDAAPIKMLSVAHIKDVIKACEELEGGQGATVATPLLYENMGLAANVEEGREYLKALGPPESEKVIKMLGYARGTK